MYLVEGVWGVTLKPQKGFGGLEGLCTLVEAGIGRLPNSRAVMGKDHSKDGGTGPASSRWLPTLPYP